MELSLAFSGSPLDRDGLRRRDAEWLAARLADASARFLPCWRGDPLLKDPPGLAWARRVLFDGHDGLPEPVFLGTGDGTAHFAVDVSALEKPVEELGLEGLARFEDLRASAGSLPAGEVAVAAQARSLLLWHGRHGRCAVCGGPTQPVQGGVHRRCIECHAEHFPRTDPVAIAVVARGEKCLLGRGPAWPASLYSALAGFVEPGESLEETVRREVFEEAGVRVGAVRYLGSQPWPFPSSLMMGCLAEGLSEEIRIDAAELADAAWFHRDAVRAALEGRGDGLVVPPPFAIAHHLIRAWLEGR